MVYNKRPSQESKGLNNNFFKLLFNAITFVSQFSYKRNKKNYGDLIIRINIFDIYKILNNNCFIVVI